MPKNKTTKSKNHCPRNHYHGTEATRDEKRKGKIKRRRPSRRRRREKIERNTGPAIATIAIDNSV